MPKFALEMIKASTGLLRRPTMPNRPVQDGLKARLLCDVCEQRFSVWERECADFVRLCNENDGPFEYGPQFGWFALSVAWRTLVWELEEGLADSWHPRAVRAAIEGEGRWRQALLSGDMSGIPGTLHALVLGSDAEPSPNLRISLPPNWNRYLDLAIDCTVATSSDPSTPGSRVSAVAYAKMGRLVLVGVLKTPELGNWKGTRIRRTGALNYGELALPHWLLEFMAERSSRSNEMMRNISQVQRAKIAARVRSQGDDTKLLRPTRAIARDVEMFGRNRVFGELPMEPPGN